MKKNLTFYSEIMSIIVIIGEIFLVPNDTYIYIKYFDILINAENIVFMIIIQNKNNNYTYHRSNNNDNLMKHKKL